jgi:hypothetical protein
MIRWRAVGESMGTVDLGELKGDHIVIHYGGALTSVDAYTFANSLISFADMVRAVSNAVDPNQIIEIRVEALEKGSFRALLKRVPKGWGDVFSKRASEFIWTLICTLIVEKLINNEPHIIISDDQVIIQKGDDRYIIPRAAYDQAKDIAKKPDIQQKISKTFETIENDPAIDNFGLTPSIKDQEPLVQFKRDEFQQLSYPVTLPEEVKGGRRERCERAVLVILKAWFKRSSSKWSFEWNGHPISAPIKDQEFFTRLEKREFLLGVGDALDVELRWMQDYDDRIMTYINDTSTFVVEKVYRPISRDVQLSLDD